MEAISKISANQRMVGLRGRRNTETRTQSPVRTREYPQSDAGKESVALIPIPTISAMDRKAAGALMKNDVIGKRVSGSGAFPLYFNCFG
jgi:hypothetical protein